MFWDVFLDKLKVKKIVKIYFINELYNLYSFLILKKKKYGNLRVMFFYIYL